MFSLATAPKSLVWQAFRMKVHLVDGTYELFRHFFGAPPHRNAAGNEVAAVRGVVSSVLQLLGDGATHVGVATDHVIESFRNDLWPGYKTGDGVDPDLWSQAGPLEDALAALGVLVWPMVELEADDALASGAAVADDDPEVEQVIICTPDKDLGQCVRGNRIVQLDRRKDLLIDEGGVEAKFGVGPTSIPDYLALVGDSADGFPGLAGWGAKSAATVLARWSHIEDIPPDPGTWEVTVRSAAKLATTLQECHEDALLFKDLATLRIDRSLLGSVDDLRWRGPTSDFAQVCADLDAPGTRPPRGGLGRRPLTALSGRCHRRPQAGEREPAEVEVAAVGESHGPRNPGMEGDPEVPVRVGEDPLPAGTGHAGPAGQDRAGRRIAARVRGGRCRWRRRRRSSQCSSRCPSRRGNSALPSSRDRGPRRFRTPTPGPAPQGQWGWPPGRTTCPTG